MNDLPEIASLTVAHKALRKLVMRLEGRIEQLEEINRETRLLLKGEKASYVQGGYQAPVGEKPDAPTTGSGVIQPQRDFPRSVGDMQLGLPLSDETMS